MAKIRKFLSRFQITYRRTKTATKIVLTVSLVLCMGSLITLRLSMNDLTARTERLRDRAAALENANNEIAENMANAGTVRGVIAIAEDELGMVQPDTVFFPPES